MINMDSFKSFFERLEELRQLQTELMVSREGDNDETPVYSNELFVDLTKSSVTVEYFEKVETIASLLVSFFDNSIATTAVHNALYNKTLLYKRRTYDDLKLCMMIDVLRCYDGLNHNTSLSTKEGMALLMLLVKVYQPEYMMTYQNLSQVPESIINLDALVPYIAQCSDEINISQDKMIISELLQDAGSTKNDVLYRTALYRFCEAISEADGVITQSEKEWLMSVLRLDDDDLSNDINIESIFTRS